MRSTPKPSKNTRILNQGEESQQNPTKKRKHNAVSDEQLNNRQFEDEIQRDLLVLEMDNHHLLKEYISMVLRKKNTLEIPEWCKEKPRDFITKLSLLDIVPTEKSDNGLSDMVREYERLVSNVAIEKCTESDIRNLLSKSPKFEGKYCDSMEIQHATWCLYPLLFRERIFMGCCEESTELELTIRLFSSLCNMSDLFGDTKTNAGGPLYKGKFQDLELNQKVKELRPDRSVSFKIPHSGSLLIRVIQENSSNNLQEVQNHPDEDKMLLMLKISHKLLMKEILNKKQSHKDLEFYSGVYTYGLLTCKNRVEIVGIRCEITKTDTEIFQFKYFLEHFGKFNLFTRQSRYRLCGFLMAIFTACTKQQERINLLLKTISKSENSKGTIESLKKPQSIFEVSDQIRISPNHNRYVVGQVDTIQIFEGKSIARVKLLEFPSTFLYIKHSKQTPNQTPHSIVFPCVIRVKNAPFLVEISFEGTCLTNVRADFKKALKMTVQLLVELGMVHKQKYIHNDVKRSNIVIYNEFTKLIDFELSKNFDTYDTETQICEHLGQKVHSKAGTPNMMPPEKEKAGSNYITPMTDIYCLGIVISEILERNLSISNYSDEQETVIAKIQEMTTNMTCQDPKQRWDTDQCLEYLVYEQVISEKDILQELENHSKTSELVKSHIQTFLVDSSVMDDQDL